MSVLKTRSYLPAGVRRTQILAAAKTVLARRGYNRTNVAQICAAARIARGTFYVYFDNKRDVLLALLDDVVVRVDAILGRRTRIGDLRFDLARLDAATVVAFCEARMRELLDVIFVDEATLRLVLREARGLDGVVDKVVARIDRGVLAAMERDLDEAQQIGVFARTDSKMMARYSLGGIEKLILTALAQGEPLDLDRVVSLTVRLQLFGLLTDEITRQGGRT